MCFVSITYMVHHGLGKHIWVAPMDAGVVWAKGLFISEVSYTIIICSIKFSLLAFYWRLFKQSKIRVPIYILTFVVSCWGLAVLLVTVLQCRPVGDFWNRFAPDAKGPFHCGVNVNQFFNGNSIPNIITDAALLVLPIPCIWKLQLPRAQKLALTSIFILGIFVIGVSIARFTFIINLDLVSPDITWNFVNVQIWTGVEAHVGIICACLPSLRPLLNLVLFGSIDRSHRSSPSGRKTSGGLVNRPQHVWDAHLKGLHTRRGKTGDETTDEESSRGFARLSDQGQQEGTYISAVDVPLKDMPAEPGINVRTDVYVGSPIAPAMSSVDDWALLSGEPADRTRVVKLSSDNNGAYALKRDYAATTRLNSQHLLWKLELGWCIHPSLSSRLFDADRTLSTPAEKFRSNNNTWSRPPDANHAGTTTVRIADLGTGTAIWALDVGQSFPQVHVDGFEIDLQQCPPREWMPRNVSVKEWDIFSDVADGLQGVYDVVHIRLLLLVIQDNDPRPLLRNAWKMLKEGGHIQWDELDPWGAYTAVAGEPIGVPGSASTFQHKQELTAMVTLKWVQNLHLIMVEMGFEAVKSQQIPCDLRLAKYFQDIQYMVMEEEMAVKGTAEEKEAVRLAIRDSIEDSRSGKARVTPKIIISWVVKFSAFGSLLIYCCVRVRREIFRQRQIRLHRCKPPNSLPQFDRFFGLDIVFQALSTFRSNKRNGSLQDQFRSYGTTFQCQIYSTTRIFTIAPQNLQSVFNADFESWGVEPLRLFFFGPFVGKGIMTADGSFWNHSRTLLKPTFSRSQISDLSGYRVHVENLLARLSEVDGQDIDLKPCFEKLALDSSTEFLFGHSTGSLTLFPTLDAQAFLEAYNYGQAGIGKRMQLPQWDFLTRDQRFWDSCTLARGFVEKCVTQTFSSIDKVGVSKKHPKRLILAHQLASQTRDRGDIINQLLNVFLPAHDATAVALTNVFFHLSRHPVIYGTLRKEIMSLGHHTTWTFERLKKCKYLQAVMNETFRLNPSIGQMNRAALRDTVLPTGGGPDAASPVFVKKGSVLTTSFYALHRLPELWGEESCDWRPERWMRTGDEEPMKVEPWTFLPFGGGPRICIGMQLALTEVGYAVGRVVERYERVECRDPVPEFVEEWKLSTVSRNGAKVRLVVKS
ncbi:MAG: hypothetical protein Q9174_001533 [Haloplaca sp. 1 TL-2023]